MSLKAGQAGLSRWKEPAVSYLVRLDLTHDFILFDRVAHSLKTDSEKTIRVLVTAHSNKTHLFRFSYSLFSSSRFQTLRTFFPPHVSLSDGLGKRRRLHGDDLVSCATKSRALTFLALRTLHTVRGCFEKGLKTRTANSRRPEVSDVEDMRRQRWKFRPATEKMKGERFKTRSWSAEPH